MSNSELDLNKVILGCKPIIHKIRTYMNIASNMNFLNPVKTGLYMLVMLLTILNVVLYPIFTPINIISQAWAKAKASIFQPKRLV
jgi:hypothetical protein